MLPGAVRQLTPLPHPAPKEAGGMQGQRRHGEARQRRAEEGEVALKGGPEAAPHRWGTGSWGSSTAGTGDIPRDNKRTS